MTECAEAYYSVSLAQVASSKRWALNGGPFGSKLSSKHYTESGVPVIRGTNISGQGQFNFSDFVYVSESKADELLANNAHPGDIIFTQRGTIGQVGLIPLDSPFRRFVISQSQMKLSPNLDLVDPLYIYYYFRSEAVVQALHNLAFAAGVPHINLDILRKFEIPLPPLKDQRRITGILSAYDDLIENCWRRIQILEEMARSLYREWFVHFRYPGHESVPLVPSALGPIPQGWEAGVLSDLVVLQRGFDLPKGERQSGNVPIIASTGVTGFHDKSKAKGPGIVTGRSGTIGAVMYVDEDYWPLNTSLWSKAFPKSASLYAFYALSGIDLLQFNSGAAVPTLNRNDIHGLGVVVPPLGIQNRFQEIVQPIRSAIKANRLRVAKLQSIRDLLLQGILKPH